MDKNKCNNNCVCINCYLKENCLGCTVCLHDNEPNKICQFPKEENQ